MNGNSIVTLLSAESSRSIIAILELRHRALRNGGKECGQLTTREGRSSKRGRPRAACTAAVAILASRRTSGKHSVRSYPRPPLLGAPRSEEHTSELQSRRDLVCRLLLEKKNHDSGTGRSL